MSRVRCTWSKRAPSQWMEGKRMPTERLSMRRIRQVLQLHLVREPARG